MKKTLSLLFSLSSILLVVSCNKKKFLETPPDQSLIIPKTIPDAQALLDNDVVMNGYSDSSGYPYLGECGSDDFYSSNTQFSSYSTGDQNALTWAGQNVYPLGEAVDWDLTYRVVFYANAAFAALTSITDTAGKGSDWKATKGRAFFYRAFANYQLAQIFAPAYDSNTAKSDWGLPLRMSADVNEKIFRSTVQQTYDLMIADLDSAILLLPPGTPDYATRPSIAACYGLKSRIYLSANDYKLALAYSDSCLQLRNTLMDFNTIDSNPQYPFKRFNTEVIFSAAYFPNSGPSGNRTSFVDSVIMKAYEPGDLRKNCFFKNNYFTGRYDQSGYCFCGLASDEMFLTRAECYARLGNTAAAMNDLNTLLLSRWKAGAFVPKTALDALDARSQILMERRKELLFRGLRWTDLRRLNKNPATAVTLSRVIGTKKYTLPPNDPRYTYLIPESVIGFNPNMPQNPR